MYCTALMAFLHHLAAFTAVAALAVEVALFKPPLTPLQARRLQRTDLIFGVAASLVLVAGLVRVTYFEKGPAYYWHDAYFLVKFAAFLVASLISIYPTVIFLAWKRELKAGAAPQLDPQRVRGVRLCLRLELTAIVVILLCAALMARGFGFHPRAAGYSGAAPPAAAAVAGVRGCASHAASAGKRMIAASMFTRNMKVSMMPMSAWNFSGENSQVATPIASVMPVKMMLAPVTCSVRS